MEMPQRYSLGSYLKQIKMSSFFFYKIKEQEGRTSPTWEDWYQWEGGGDGERAWVMTAVQILCTHVCKWKNDIC
jgi:hypothetical protein